MGRMLSAKARREKKECSIDDLIPTPIADIVLTLCIITRIITHLRISLLGRPIIPLPLYSSEMVHYPSSSSPSNSNYSMILAAVMIHPK
jgi:hypothetical protein